MLLEQLDLLDSKQSKFELKDTIKFFCQYGQAFDCLKGLHAEVLRQRLMLSQNQSQKSFNTGIFKDQNISKRAFTPKAQAKKSQVLQQNIFKDDNIGLNPDESVVVGNQQAYDIFKYLPQKSTTAQLWRQSKVEDYLSKTDKIQDISTQVLDDKVFQSQQHTKDTTSQSYYIQCADLEQQSSIQQCNIPNSENKHLRTYLLGQSLYSTCHLDSIEEVSSKDDLISTVDNGTYINYPKIDINSQTGKQKMVNNCQNSNSSSHNGRIFNTQSVKSYLIVTTKSKSGKNLAFSLQIETRSVNKTQRDSKNINIDSQRQISNFCKDTDYYLQNTISRNDLQTDQRDNLNSSKQGISNINSQAQAFLWSLQWPNFPDQQLMSLNLLVNEQSESTQTKQTQETQDKQSWKSTDDSKSADRKITQNNQKIQYIKKTLKNCGSSKFSANEFKMQNSQFQIQNQNPICKDNLSSTTSFSDRINNKVTPFEQKIDKQQSNKKLIQRNMQNKLYSNLGMDHNAELDINILHQIISSNTLDNRKSPEVNYNSSDKILESSFNRSKDSFNSYGSLLKDIKQQIQQQRNMPHKMVSFQQDTLNLNSSNSINKNNNQQLPAQSQMQDCKLFGRAQSLDSQLSTFINKTQSHRNVYFNLDNNLQSKSTVQDNDVHKTYKSNWILNDTDTQKLIGHKLYTNQLFTQQSSDLNQKFTQLFQAQNRPSELNKLNTVEKKLLRQYSTGSQNMDNIITKDNSSDLEKKVQDVTSHNSYAILNSAAVEIIMHSYQSQLEFNDIDSLNQFDLTYSSQNFSETFDSFFSLSKMQRAPINSGKLNQDYQKTQNSYQPQDLKYINLLEGYNDIISNIYFQVNSSCNSSCNSQAYQEDNKNYKDSIKQNKQILN